MTFRPELVKRALLIRRKALGDCLVTIPAIKQLAAAMPEATLELVVDRPFAELMSRLTPEVRVIPWHKSQGGLSWYWNLRRTPYDLVVDWLGNPRTALWVAATGASWRVGFDLPRRHWAYNVKVPRNQKKRATGQRFSGDAFIDPLRSLGLPVQPWQPGAAALKLKEGDLSPSYNRWIDDFFVAGGPVVAMMMSATWSAKAYPARHVARLWELMEASGRRALFIPGPGDEELVSQLKSTIPPAAFAPPTTLLEVADLIGKCVAFVGTDCGPRHLATVLGLPTVTLFGPTDPIGWNPIHPHHVSITNPVDCLGCDHLICPRPGRPCLEDLEAEAVMAGLETLNLERSRGNNSGRDTTGFDNLAQDSPEG